MQVWVEASIVPTSVDHFLCGFTDAQGDPRYETLQFLSSGSYGFVVLALDRTTNSKVAIKFIERLQGKITKNVEREILNHSLLIHPHVVQFKHCFLSPQYLAIAMEYAEGGTMHGHVRRHAGLDEDRCRWFYQQIILALDYCHKMNISNRDIKLENTLLDSKRPPMVKLCDFGYSINESHSLPKTAVGTAGYTAPEVLRGRTYNAKAADVWSSGVMLYAMLCCDYPFERAEDEGNPQGHQRIVQRIVSADYSFPARKYISPEYKDLISRIFTVDPATRITIAEIQEHPWFKKNLPKSWDMDRYNANYVAASQAAVANQPAIMRVLDAARIEGGRPSGELPDVGIDDMDDDLDADFDL